MFEKFKNSAPKEIIPGFTARFIHTPSQTLSLVEVKKGAVLPKHSHPHIQISQVLEGKFQLTINETTKICTKGDIAIMESNEEHSGKAITDCIIFDVFTPVREDYL